MRRTSAALAIALLTLAGSADALAQQSIAVLGIEPQDVPETLARELTDALRQRAAASHGFAMAPAKDLIEIKLVFGCVDESPSCMAHAGKTLGADKLLFGAIKRSPSGFRVTLKWLDVSSAHLENQISEPIPADVLSRDGLRPLAARWFSALSGIKIGGALHVSANVAGAQVFVDDKLVGTSTTDSPVVVPQLAAGSHQVRVERSGYKAWVTRVKVGAGEIAQVSARLSEEPTEKVTNNVVEEHPTDVEQPGRGARIAFWPSLAVTLGSVAAVVGFGLHTWSLEDDKLAAKSSSPVDAVRNAGPNDNLCQLAKTSPGDSKITGICDDGNRSAMLTNVFIGVGVVSLAATAYFYYKGYMDVGTTEKAPSTASRLRLSPYGGQVGGGIVAEFEF